MPPPPHSSGPYGKHRLSTAPPSTTASASSNKHRQLSHLNSQLTQLHAHLSDLEDLVRMTAVQAEHIRALGGIHGALLMSAAKILGEGGVVAGTGFGEHESGEK
ncbi:DASH complex subunit Hsk3 like-domain-containing protein [Terfezia claveryi]|nr:DASH complex subunit Hsk3 like-domain-containing protein [Terfezia claveryi]